MALRNVGFAAAGIPWEVPVSVAAPPPEIFDLPDGMYGVAYDFTTNKIQTRLPQGWGSPRCEYMRYIKVASNRR